MEGTVFTPCLEGMKNVKSEQGELLTKNFLDVCKLILPVIGATNFVKILLHARQPDSDRQPPCIPIGISTGTCRHFWTCKSRSDPCLNLKRHRSSHYSHRLDCAPISNKFGAAMALVKSDIGGNITRLETKYTSNPSKYELLYSMVQEEVEAKTAKGSSSCTNGLLWLTRAMDFLVELFRNLLEHPDWSMSQACSESYGKTLKKWHGWLASSSFSIAMKLAPDRKKFMEVIGGSGDINADIEKFCTEFPPLLQENHKFLASVGLDDMKAS